MSDRSRREIHQDPMLRQVVRAQLSRRSVLRGAGGIGVAAALAACGTGDDTTGTTDKPAAATVTSVGPGGSGSTNVSDV